MWISIARVYYNLFLFFSILFINNHVATKSASEENHWAENVYKQIGLYAPAQKI